MGVVFAPMTHRLLAVLILPLVCACATTGSPPPATEAAQSASAPHRRAQPLSAGEIIRRLEESPRTYRIDKAPSTSHQALQQYAMAMWPQRGPTLDCVNARPAEGGQQRPVPCGDDAAVRAILVEAETFWDKKEYAEAEKRYARALEVAPRDYHVLLVYGDAAYFQGRFDEALTRYEKATEVNPWDHRSWYYRGNVLLDQGKRDEALQLYARALALRPRHHPMELGLENREERLGVTLVRNTFLPKAKVSRAGEEVVIETEVVGHWMAWASCKALWLGEASHRVEMTGTDQHAFSSVEELECLAALLSVYVRGKEERGVEPEPQLERLLRVVEAGMAKEWVAWELGTRIAPHLIVSLPEAERRRVEAFVRAFVLEPEGAAAYDPTLRRL